MAFSSYMPLKIIPIFFVRTSQDVREAHFSSSPAMSPPHINLCPQGRGYVPANAHPHRAPRITEGSDRDSEIYVFGSSCLLCARYCQSALHILTHLNFTILWFKGYFLSPFYGWANWGSKTLSKLSRAAQPIRMWRQESNWGNLRPVHTLKHFIILSLTKLSRAQWWHIAHKNTISKSNDTSYPAPPATKYLQRILLKIKSFTDTFW